MLDVGIEVEVRVHGGAQPVLIGPRVFDMGCSQPDCRQPLGEDVLGVSTDLRKGQNYGAGYLFLSLESFASWRLERSGREILIGNCF